MSVIVSSSIWLGKTPMPSTRSPAIMRYLTREASILDWGGPTSMFSHLTNLSNSSSLKWTLPTWTSARNAAHRGTSDLLAGLLGMSGQMNSLAIRRSCLYFMASTQSTWSLRMLRPPLTVSLSLAMTVMESSASSSSTKSRDPEARLSVTMPMTFALDLRGIFRMLPMDTASLMSMRLRRILSSLLNRFRK